MHIDTNLYFNNKTQTKSVSFGWWSCRTDLSLEALHLQCMCTAFFYEHPNNDHFQSALGPLGVLYNHMKDPLPSHCSNRWALVQESQKRLAPSFGPLGSYLESRKRLAPSFDFGSLVIAGSFAYLPASFAPLTGTLLGASIPFFFLPFWLDFLGRRPSLSPGPVRMEYVP